MVELDEHRNQLETRYINIMKRYSKSRIKLEPYSGYEELNKSVIEGKVFPFGHFELRPVHFVPSLLVVLSLGFLWISWQVTIAIIAPLILIQIFFLISARGFFAVVGPEGIIFRKPTGKIQTYFWNEFNKVETYIRSTKLQSPFAPQTIYMTSDEVLRDKRANKLIYVNLIPQVGKTIELKMNDFTSREFMDNIYTQKFKAEIIVSYRYGSRNGIRQLGFDKFKSYNSHFK